MNDEIVARVGVSRMAVAEMGMSEDVVNVNSRDSMGFAGQFKGARLDALVKRARRIEP